MPGSRKPKEEDNGPPRAWILGHDENQLYDVMALMSGRPVRLYVGTRLRYTKVLTDTRVMGRCRQYFRVPLPSDVW